ncbi:MAG: hypothetical protein ACFB2X_23345 [Rivularia sp. (in: cyanobacteria)]
MAEKLRKSNFLLLTFYFLRTQAVLVNRWNLPLTEAWIMPV